MSTVLRYACSVEVAFVPMWGFVLAGVACSPMASDRAGDDGVIGVDIVSVGSGQSDSDTGSDSATPSLDSGAADSAQSQDGGEDEDGDDEDDGDLDVDTPRFDLLVPDGGNVDPLECEVLRAEIRDFRSAHPDFERFSGSNATRGIVANMLGGADKPVFTGTALGSQIASADSFAQWYADVAGTNQRFEYDIVLERSPAGDACVYDNSAFFPIDGRGFGNEGSVDSTGMSRNFHFTTEIATRFTYHAGQIFTFTGDDDLWMFVGGRLAIDLGGLHPALSQSVNLDDLGLVVGSDYTMHIFHAERHTNHSNFRIETNITFDPPG